MHISKLIIRNYRNFSNATFHFQKGVNTLIGENGSGKTNVFQTLRILLDSNMPRNIGNLKEIDFNRMLGDNWKGHWIILSVEFADVSNSDVSQALLNHGAGIHTEGNGYYSLYFRPNIAIRKQFYEFSQLNSNERTHEAFQELQSTIKIESYQADYFCKGAPMNFNDEAFYKIHVGDFENFVFPNPDKEDATCIGVIASSMQTTVGKEFSFTFAEALRDVEADLKNHWNSPLQLLLRGIENDISEEDKIELQTHSKELNTTIGGLNKIQEVQKGIIERLDEAIGETYSPSLQLRANVPENIEMLVRQLVVEACDPDDDYFGRIGELSLGAANLIYLAMKLHSYHLQLPADRSAYFLMIEEPEAHLHAHIQKTLFQKIDHNKAQIIYSTHSTHVSSVSRASAVNVLSKHGKQSLVFQPTKGLTKDEITRLERYLDVTRSTLLFAKSVMLVEGDAEQILIPVIIEKVFGVHLDELGISIVNVGSTAFTNIANVFGDDRIRKKCAIVTDEDACFYREPITQTQNYKDALNSELKGAERKVILDEYCKDKSRQDLVAPFYGKYTFEVEIVKIGNTHFIVSLLTEIYSRESDIKSSKEKLEGDGIKPFEEVLRLAKKEKKGWFALLLAPKIDSTFKIPYYILDALAFCTGNLKKGILEKIYKYRLKELGLSDTILITDFIKTHKFDVFVKFLVFIKKHTLQNEKPF